MSSPTRVPSEQIKFRSTLTGEHSLDIYLEDAELGGKTLAQLLAQLYDAVTGTPLAGQINAYFLGPRSSDPATDGSGNPLVAGAVYYNTGSGDLRLYTGSTWVDGFLNSAGSIEVAGNLVASGQLINGGPSFPNITGVTFTVAGEGLIASQNGSITHRRTNAGWVQMNASTPGGGVHTFTSEVADFPVMSLRSAPGQVPQSNLFEIKDADGDLRMCVREWFANDGVNSRKSARIGLGTDKPTSMLTLVALGPGIDFVEVDSDPDFNGQAIRLADGKLVIRKHSHDLDTGLKTNEVIGYTIQWAADGAASHTWNIGATSPVVLDATGLTVDTPLDVTDVAITGQVSLGVATLPTSGSHALDGSAGPVQTCTLTAPITFTDSIADGTSFTLLITPGAHAVTWPTVDWKTADGNAPTLDAGENTISFLKAGGTLRGYPVWIG